MGIFSDIKTIKVSHEQLVQVFDQFLLTQEYRALWDTLLKNIQKTYFGSKTDTPDNKYTFYMATTYVYTFPLTKKYIWIRDNENKTVYELNNPYHYKKFLNAAAGVIISKKAGSR